LFYVLPKRLAFNSFYISLDSFKNINYFVLIKNIIIWFLFGIPIYILKTLYFLLYKKYNLNTCWYEISKYENKCILFHNNNMIKNVKLDKNSFIEYNKVLDMCNFLHTKGLILTGNTLHVGIANKDFDEGGYYTSSFYKKYLKVLETSSDSNFLLIKSPNFVFSYEQIINKNLIKLIDIYGNHDILSYYSKKYINDSKLNKYGDLWNIKTYLIISNDYIQTYNKLLYLKLSLTNMNKNERIYEINKEKNKELLKYVNIYRKYGFIKIIEEYDSIMDILK
jgi:hypothetical protein